MDAQRDGSPRETTASRPRILLSFAKSVVGRRPVTSTWYEIETESCHSCHDTDGRIFGSRGRWKRKGMRRMCESGGGYADPRVQMDCVRCMSSLLLVEVTRWAVCSAELVIMMVTRVEVRTGSAVRR